MFFLDFFEILFLYLYKHQTRHARPTKIKQWCQRSIGGHFHSLTSNLVQSTSCHRVHFKANRPNYSHNFQTRTIILEKPLQYLGNEHIPPYTILYTMTQTKLQTLATSTATAIPTYTSIKTIEPQKKNKKQAVWANSPVIMAMLTNNNLSSCQDVTRMISECHRTNSKDQVCFAAEKRMETTCGTIGRILEETQSTLLKQKKYKSIVAKQFGAGGMLRM